jgi:hypothetical protein
MVKGKQAELKKSIREDVESATGTLLRIRKKVRAGNLSGQYFYLKLLRNELDGVIGKFNQMHRARQQHKE